MNDRPPQAQLFTHLRQQQATPAYHQHNLSDHISPLPASNADPRN